MLYFENDYCEGAHPAILQKLTETNFEKVSGYGTDPYCASAKEKIRTACACPEADVFFISGGTQANSIVIASTLRRNFSGGFRFYDAVVNDRALIERAYACGMDY